MATRFEIVLAGTDEQSAQCIAEEALREISELHDRLNRFATNSLIAHINRTAAFQPVRVDAATFGLLRAAQTVCEQSKGAFDVALGSGRFILDDASFTIQFEHGGVALDLGGIAKGFALDRAGAILRAEGVTSALLHGGTSSVLAIGSPPGADAWRVQLAHGARRCIALADGALSVSRPHAQMRDGHTHIIDPHTRQSIAQRCCAVVKGPSACLADAWSTALAVLGERPQALSAEWMTSIEVEND